MVEVKLSLNKSVDENAAVYFEKSKKAKKKLQGVKFALERSRQQLEEFKKKYESILEEEKNSEVVERKKDWYEKFRWFFTSEGLLVIGGRDATTNELVVKKHTDQSDLVFHTDMAGGPFFVLKVSGEFSEKSIQQAADATITFSRAWKLGLGSTEVFHVKPEQVSKQPQAGEFLPKGAFVIRGKTNYVNAKMSCAVGFAETRVIYGPVEAVASHTNEYVVLEQSSDRVKTSELAKQIKKKIGGDLDEIMRALPPGNSRIKS